MPSLLDIAPPELSAETIDIRGTKLTVTGIGADGWAALYARFPALQSVISGRVEGLAEIDIMRGMAGMVAAGLGQPGNPEFERSVMDNLTYQDQGVLMEVIKRLSMPGHVFGPLLNGAAHDLAPAPDTAGPATK